MIEHLSYSYYSCYVVVQIIQIAAAVIVVRIICGGFFNPPKKIKNIVHIKNILRRIGDVKT